MTRLEDHRSTMSSYYGWQSRIYDATRWTFLLDRAAILDDLDLRPGETVVEIGCGTGRNIAPVLRRIGDEGTFVGVDCSAPMLDRCRARIRRNEWGNVHIVDQEYGTEPVERGSADAVLLSYSLSMIPSWRSAIAAAYHELKPGGRIGVVDFCLDRETAATSGFARWMAVNHVTLARPYRETLRTMFYPAVAVTNSAFGGLWSYYRFVGRRE